MPAPTRSSPPTLEIWHPSISLARRIGHQLGADVMILARSEGGRWAAASWGRTSERCASIGRVLDRIFDVVIEP